jgi:hypothetical protein
VESVKPEVTKAATSQPPSITASWKPYLDSIGDTKSQQGLNERTVNGE